MRKVEWARCTVDSPPVAVVQLLSSNSVVAKVTRRILDEENNADVATFTAI